VKFGMETDREHANTLCVTYYLQVNYKHGNGAKL